MLHAAYPIGHETRILARRHALPWPPVPTEQKFARFLAEGSHVVVNGLPGLLGDFEPDRNARLFLPDGGAIDGVSMGRNVVDLESHDIAPAQLAVDGEIEYRQVTGASLDLQLGPDRPNMLCRRGAFAPINLPLFQVVRLGTARFALSSSCMVILLVTEDDHHASGAQTA